MSPPRLREGAPTQPERQLTHYLHIDADVHFITGHNTSRYFDQDWKALVTGYINNTNSMSGAASAAANNTAGTEEKKTRVVTMIPPPFMNFSCPTATTADQLCQGTNQSCVINCILPRLIPLLTSEAGVEAPPVDLLAFFGGPDHTNKSMMPNLHPNCHGYLQMGTYIATQVFGV